MKQQKYRIVPHADGFGVMEPDGSFDESQAIYPPERLVELEAKVGMLNVLLLEERLAAEREWLVAVRETLEGHSLHYNGVYWVCPTCRGYAPSVIRFPHREDCLFDRLSEALADLDKPA